MRINIKTIDNRLRPYYNNNTAGNTCRKRGITMIDWIIGIVIAAAVIAVIAKKIKDAKDGKSGCGCGGCSGCPSKGKCH